MKLGKQVYRNKLNGEFYRELIASNMPCGITLNKESIKKLNGGVGFFFVTPKNQARCECVALAKLLHTSKKSNTVQ